MTALGVRRGHRPLLLPAIGCLVLAMATTALSGAARAADPVPPAADAIRDPMTVRIDKASLIKLPERTVTLVIGNPLIADAVVQPGGMAVITAKSYGATNLIALDRSGNTLMDQLVQVTGPADQVVLVYRGIERETYSCAPNCERRLTVGDSAASLTANLQTLSTYTAAAQGLQQKQ